MRTAVLADVERLELRERERPSPDADEVLVAVGEVGICGSDLHYYHEGRIGDYAVEEPLILGHEAAGEVAEVGEDVTDLSPGDRVAIEPGVPCRRCAHCRRGEYNLCPDVTFMATPPDDGAFAEYVAWPADSVHALPEGVSTREGALCEPLSVGIHACRRAEVGVGDSVLIAGCGPIGLLAMEAARAAGATEVIAADVVPEKLAFAAERGADATVDVRETSLAEGVGNREVDVVVEASGAGPSIAGTVDAVRRGGTIVFVGLPTDDVPIDVGHAIDNELDVLGSFRYRNTYPAAIDLLAGGRVDVAGIVDFVEPLEAIEAAFVRASEPESVKGMISLRRSA